MRKARGPRKTRPGILRRLRRVLMAASLLVLLSSIAVVLAMRWVDPGFSAVMLQRLVQQGAPQHQVWVDIGRVDPNMALAIVAAEDQRFPHHWGFDTTQIIAAVEQHLEGGRLRGASTISQQVARNLFLWQGRSFLRKGLEVWFTVLVETLWSKRRILEMYLNFAETGERMFGVTVASRTYFDREPERLTRRQAALIAAVLPNPRMYRVDAPSPHVKKRQRWILQQMRNLGGAAYLQDILSRAAAQ